jgi:hypothetical protein
MSNNSSYPSGYGSSAPTFGSVPPFGSSGKPTIPARPTSRPDRQPYDNRAYTPPTFPNGSNDKLVAAQKQVQDLTVIMHDNITKTLDRGEQIEIAVEKSAILERDADKFKTGATKLKWHFCRQHYKIMALIAVIIVVILLIIIYSVKSRT